MLLLFWLLIEFTLCYDVSNFPLVGLSYERSLSGIIYSDYVTLVRLRNGIYHPSITVHSSNLSIGSLILWPGSEFNESGNLLFRIEHYSITEKHTRCCIGVGKAICELKGCCGGGCCCAEEPLVCAGIICHRDPYRICCPDGQQASCNCFRDRICQCG